LKNKLEIYAKFRHGTGYKPTPAREVKKQNFNETKKIKT